MYYNDYINFALRPMIISGYVKAEFVKIKNIELLPEDIETIWEQNYNNPYLHDDNFRLENLGKSIIDIGTWFPVFIFPNNNQENKYYVYEGRHRLASLLLLQDKGILENDYEIFCIITHKLIRDDYHEYLPLKKAIGYRTIFNPIFYCSREHLKITAEGFDLAISVDGGTRINDYTAQYEAKSADEIMRAVMRYHFPLTRLIYFVGNSIKPSSIINNKKEYYKWINEEQG